MGYNAAKRKIMNEQVSAFIEEQKQKKLEEFNRKKNEHLIELGLVDEIHTKPKEYLEGTASQWYREMHGYIHCDEKGWYKNTPLALNVTDEEYEEICKVCPPKNEKDNNTDIKLEKKYSSSNLAEGVVKIFAWFDFIVSIIAFFALLVISFDSYKFNWISFGIGVGVLLSTIITWALPLVLVNISQKLDNL